MSANWHRKQESKQDQRFPNHKKRCYLATALRDALQRFRSNSSMRDFWVQFTAMYMALRYSVIQK